MRFWTPKSGTSGRRDTVRAARERGAPTGLVVTRAGLERDLGRAGLAAETPRLAGLRTALAAQTPDASIALDDLLSGLDGGARRLVLRALGEELIAPDFPDFVRRLGSVFETARSAAEGKVASYIPALAEASPRGYAAAVCTVDGQEAAFGDAATTFTIQSLHKPFSYALALARHGVGRVHQHMGVEPSGRRFNELTLNADGLPHNPMVNAGGIMSAALLGEGMAPDAALDHLRAGLQGLAGRGVFALDERVYVSEQATADRNFAIGHFMREAGAFPEGADMRAALDLYFRGCSLSVDVRDLAALGAALANDGISALTGAPAMPTRLTRHVLSIMFTCGMYDASGELAFSVGMPAKSGVSGGLLLVEPGFGAFAVWSPPLDPHGHSVRGLAFARALAQAFPFHVFGPQRRDEAGLKAAFAPSRGSFEIFRLLTAARAGDVARVRRYLARGVPIDATDYDGRTALHVAASAGHEDVVDLLLAEGAPRAPRDARGETPADVARLAGRNALADRLTATPR